MGNLKRYDTIQLIRFNFIDAKWQLATNIIMQCRDKRKVLKLFYAVNENNPIQSNEF